MKEGNGRRKERKEGRKKGREGREERVPVAPCTSVYIYVYI